MKILVTGVNGFVGRRLMQDIEGAVAAPSLRNASEEEVRRVVEESGAGAILHTAAISDIGQCAEDPEGSYKANVLLPVYLTKAAKACGIKMIGFSSDQVYSGLEEEGPYKEETVKPGNLYAKEKIEMENRVLDMDPTAVLLRAEWMYDYVSYKGNYILNLLGQIERGEIPVQSSGQFRGITYVKEVSEAVPALIKAEGGIYNFGSETQSSMKVITEEFLKFLGKAPLVKDAPARHNLWMDCSKARSQGIYFSEVLEGLKRCAGDYGIV